MAGLYINDTVILFSDKNLAKNITHLKQHFAHLLENVPDEVIMENLSEIHVDDFIADKEAVTMSLMGSEYGRFLMRLSAILVGMMITVTVAYFLFIIFVKQDKRKKLDPEIGIKPGAKWPLRERDKIIGISKFFKDNETGSNENGGLQSSIIAEPVMSQGILTFCHKEEGQRPVSLESPEQPINYNPSGQQAVTRKRSLEKKPPIS